MKDTSCVIYMLSKYRPSLFHYSLLSVFANALAKGTTPVIPTWSPHRSTNRAQTGLTSLSEREAVLSCWYGRSWRHYDAGRPQYPTYVWQLCEWSWQPDHSIRTDWYKRICLLSCEQPLLSQANSVLAQPRLSLDQVTLHHIDWVGLL